MANGLIVHAGGSKVTREEVAAIQTPKPTESHYPVPHLHIYDTAVEHLTRHGFKVEGEEFAVNHEGMEFFALLQLTNGRNHSDYSLIAGIRNSHNKTFSASLALGSRVFVCDNLAFSGEVTFARKHTRFIGRDLPFKVSDAMGRLGILRENQEKRIEAYKALPVTDNGARVAIFKAAETDILSSSKMLQVWKEWQEPKHEDFRPRTGWSLFNGFTEVLKAYNVQDLPKRTQALHNLMDRAANVQFN